MEAIIDRETVYCVEGLLDSANFFENLGRLVPREDWTLGIGSYDLAPNVWNWLDSQSKSEVRMEYDFRRLFDIHRDGYPLGGAFYLPPKIEILAQLGEFVSECESTEFSCDHVIGFDDGGGIFSFHDAFQGGRLLISPSIPRENIEDFCSHINAPFSLVANPQRNGP